MPTLPFQPEPLSPLQLRYPQALRRAFVVNGKYNPDDRPGMYRENTFDCEDDMRLIIHIEMHGADRVLMFSASYSNPDWELSEKTMAQFVDRFYQISSETNPVKVSYISPFGIPFFIVDDPNHVMVHGHSATN